MVSYMVSIINAASLFGRIVPGILADGFGAYNIIVLVAGISGINCMCWTKATSMARIAMLSLAYGFSSGVSHMPVTPYFTAVTDFIHIGLQGACAAHVAQPQRYGIAMGAVMGVLSIA